jgi:hypothetical protein
MINEINFLDLEGTIIDTWNSPSIINHQLKKLLENKTWHIFSFALLDEKDQNFFNNTLKNEIEKTFNCQVVADILINEITIAVALLQHIFLRDIAEVIDYRNTLGKSIMLLKYIKLIGLQDHKITFIDDMIENEIIHQLDKNNTITMIKV